jgi:hypothetical protein
MKKYQLVFRCKPLQYDQLLVWESKAGVSKKVLNVRNQNTAGLPMSTEALLQFLPRSLVSARLRLQVW